jgi:hypothetical protein
MNKTIRTVLNGSLALAGLLWVGSATTASGQLQWSSYDKNGNLVTANVASGGDSTYGGSVTFTIPATTQLEFLTKTFVPFSTPAAGNSGLVTFNISMSGGLTSRCFGFGLFNNLGTLSQAMGYWGDFNISGPYFECFQRNWTNLTFMSYDGGNALNSGKANSGTPVAGTTYSGQIQVNNKSGSMQMGTASSSVAAAGLVCDGSGVTQQSYTTTPKAGTNVNVTTFNEFGVMFNNSTANPVTLTLSSVSLVPPNPAISSQPTDFSGRQGSTALYTVGLSPTSLTPLYYQWYETNATGVTQLTDTTTAAGSVISGSATATLSIANGQSADNGRFFVVITNSYGSATSYAALFAILSDTPPAITCMTPTNATVVAGTGTNFTVCAIASPTPTYYWFDNNSNLLQSGPSTMLTLANLQPANVGTYSVVASNYLGTASTNFTVNVIVPPCISQQPASVLVNVGDPVAFAVTEGGCANPAPTYQWYKSANAATATAAVNAISGATTSGYSIGSVALSDIAYYAVIISNSAGAVTSTPAKLAIYSTTLTAATPVSPANNATNICYDTPLYVSFNQTPFVGNTGKIRIYNAANPGTPVDVIDLGSNNVVISTLSAGIFFTNSVQPHSLFPGDTQVIYYSPVLISGATAAIYPHGGVLTSNETYYVTMDSGVIVDSAGAYFAGISDTNAWQFTTKAAGPANPTNLVVAADGTGDFLTVQGAVDSVPLGNNNYTVINIANGTYTEIVDVSGKSNITFSGQSRYGTVVGYDNDNNLNPTTAARMAFKVNGSDIRIENLTLTNSTPQGGSQAETLLIYNSGIRCVVYNCDIVSRQDTILINGSASQGYFYNCRIEGNYDYVWGVGVGYFDTCVLHTLTNIYSSSYNLTAARTQTGSSYSAATPWVNPNGTNYSAYGFSFVHCTIESDAGLTSITLADSNGTSGGLDSWAFCTFDGGYIAPSTALSNSYVFWQFSNTDPTGMTPVSFTNVQTIGVTNNDPRLLAATNIVTWFSGWTPEIAPDFLTNPVSQSIGGGAELSLTAFATGIPSPAYQWLKDGNPLAGQTGPTLSIGAAYAGDAATYSVVASNAAGVVTSLGAVVTVGNTAPTLAPIADQTVNVGVTVTVTPVASDPDVPTQTLSFSLASGPANATIDPQTGVFSWRPAASQGGATYPITIMVTDNGTPVLSATQSFNVIVNPLTQPAVSSPMWSAGQFVLTLSGQIGPDYIIQTSTNLVDWTSIATNTPAAMPFQWTDTVSGPLPMLFYRIQVGPILPPPPAL